MGALILAAAGSVEGAVRLARDPGLRDSRTDAFQFLWLGIVIYASAGLILGCVCGLILALFRSGSTKRSSRIHRWSVLALALVPVIPCVVFGGGLLGGKTAPEGSPSIVLITVDTLRADALGSFREGLAVPAGLERSRTPLLDAFGAASWIFLDASTPIPKTPQSISTLMTGDYPPTHGLRTLFEKLGPDNVTVAEILRENGWATQAVITNGLIDRPSGIAQGFDVYRPRDGLRAPVKEYLAVQLAARIVPGTVRYVLNRWPSMRITSEVASVVTDRAVAAVEANSDRPYFLWVHYLDPHWPYAPPEPWNARSDTMPGAPLTIYDDLRAGRMNIGEMIHRNRMTVPEVERLVSLYGGEVSYLDQEVGRLLDAVRASPLSASTVIIFTSDHGESLGEHRYFFSHGDQVYQPSVRIPLIIQVPEGGARRTGVPVTLADIAPTILDLVRITPAVAMEGRSVLPHMAREAGSQEQPDDAQPLLFGESDLSYLIENPWVTIPGEAGKVRYVRQGRWKLVRYPRDVAAARRFDASLGTGNEGRVTPLGSIETTKLGASSADLIELFDLAKDPLELSDLSRQDPERTAFLTRALDAWFQSRFAPSSPQRPDEKELLEKLKSLGYVN